MLLEIPTTLEGRLIWQREYTKLEATELICGVMKEKGVTRGELAVLLGVTRGRVSQILDGGANMTLGTLSDCLTALGVRLKCDVEPIR